MRQLVINSQAVGDFVADKSGGKGKFLRETAISFGVVENDQILGGVVFNEYNGRNVKMHVASDGGKRWLTKDLLYACMHYAFTVMNVRRITAEIDSDNVTCLRNALGMGFEWEAVLKDAGPRNHLLLLSLFKEKCKYLDKAIDYVTRRQ